MTRPAAFTIVRNEADFLPLWLRYYGRFADTFVVDHESDDGSTAGPGNIIPAAHPTTDDAEWLAETARRYQRELLGRGYAPVVYTDVDEFLVPAPARAPDLGAYLGHAPAPVVTATGFDVCWAPADPPLDLARPVLAQRPRWQPNPAFFNKPLIGRVPLDWTIGMHHLRGGAEPPPDPGLYLIHLHYADRELAWDRLRRRMRGRTPDPGPWSGQNKTTDRAAFDREFDAVVRGAAPIPAGLRDLF